HGVRGGGGARGRVHAPAAPGRRRARRGQAPSAGVDPGRPRRARLPAGGWATFPVNAADRLVGVLALGGRAVSRMNRETEAFLSQVANQAHIVMENSRLFERLNNLSIRDSLTES